MYQELREHFPNKKKWRTELGRIAEELSSKSSSELLEDQNLIYQLTRDDHQDPKKDASFPEIGEYTIKALSTIAKELSISHYNKNPIKFYDFSWKKLLIIYAWQRVFEYNKDRQLRQMGI